jgi:hypothetical protein
MKTKQSILEDYSEMELITMKDLAEPEQKYIHFWDFMDLDEKVHEFQARMGTAIAELKEEMNQKYKDYYTRVYVQSPDKFIRHNRELLEIEYMLENPFFLAIIHFALIKEMDDRELRYLALTHKKKLMEKRMGIKDNIYRDIEKRSELLIR